MDAQASNQFPAPEGQDQKGRAQAAKPPARETSQAERAAMHPEPHEVEWGYYFGTLNDPA
ncbi:MAG TPA: hypothetical protein VGA61_16105 [Anaerolineae bacterium]